LAILVHAYLVTDPPQTRDSLNPASEPKDGIPQNVQEGSPLLTGGGNKTNLWSMKNDKQSVFTLRRPTGKKAPNIIEGLLHSTLRTGLKGKEGNGTNFWKEPQHRGNLRNLAVVEGGGGLFAS